MYNLPGLPVAGSGIPYPQTSTRHFRSRERLRSVKQAATRQLRDALSSAVAGRYRIDAPADAVPNALAALDSFRKFPLAAFVLQIEEAAGIFRAPKYTPGPLPVAPVMRAREIAPEPRKTHRAKARAAERAAHVAVINAKTEADRLAALLAWQALTQLGANEIGRIIAPKIGAFVQAVMRDPVADRIAARVAKANAAAGVGQGAAR